MANNYNLEWQITWDQLAPSLQTLFITIQDEMNTLQNNYRIMVNKLNTYTIKVDQNTTNIQINASDIALLKKLIGTLQTQISDVLSLIGGLDIDAIGDLTQLRKDVDWCIEEINELWKRIHDHEKRITENTNNIVELRIDLDRLYEDEEWLKDWVAHLTEEVLKDRIDIDRNTEVIDYLVDRTDNLYTLHTELRIDVDRNTEWIQELVEKFDTMDMLSVPKIYALYDELAELRKDTDRNTELEDHLDDLIGGFDERITNVEERVYKNEWDIDAIVIDLKSNVPLHFSEQRTDIDRNTEWLDEHEDRITALEVEAVENRKDTDRNTEWIKENEERITELECKAVDARTDIDKNTEMIQDIYDKIDALPDKIKKELMDYINKMRYLNMAPHVNFNQEDIIECYPVYRTNNMKKFAVTSDSEGNEVLYIIANSGASLESYDLYQAYRTEDNQSFFFSNITVSPKCFYNSSGDKEAYITDIISCTNDALCVYANYGITDSRSGWYLVMTNMDREYARWDTCKKLDIVSDKTIAVRYFQEYDTLMVVNKTDYFNDLKYANIATMRIYRYSNLALLQSYYITNPMQILTCNTDVCSFDSNSVEGTFINGNAGDLGYSIDTPISDTKQGFQISAAYYDADELFTLILKYANIPYIPKSKVGSTTSPEVVSCALKLNFKCPKKVVDGNGSASDFQLIEKVGDLYFDPTDLTSYFFQDNIQASSMLVSYDTIKDRVYLTWHEFLTYMSYFKRFDPSKQSTSDWETRGTGDPYYLDKGINTPDACPWGKRFYKYIMAWDYVFINCSSMMYGDCVLWIKKWQRDTTDISVILPSPGQYQQIDALPMFTTWNDSSCKTSSGDPRYFHCDFDFTTGGVSVYEYIKNETSTNFTVSKSHVFDATLDISSLAIDILNPRLNFARVFYNVNDDIFVLVCDDDTRDTSYISYSDYSFLATYDHDGSLIHNFGMSNLSNYSSDWKAICNYVQSAKLNSDIVAQIRAMSFVDGYTLFSFFYTSPSGSYSNQDFKSINVKFTNSYKSMTMTNGLSTSFVEKVYTQAMPQGTGLVYSGKTLGLTFQGDKYDPTYQSLLTQNAIPNTFGSSYTTTDMVTTVGQLNRYKMELKSAVGLIIYIPAVCIFLGGYYTAMENPIAVPLEANSNNYIYLQRNSETLEIEGYASKVKVSNEGSRVFSRILIACAVTDDDSVTDVIYYHINIGYNDYTFHTTGS